MMEVSSWWADAEEGGLPLGEVQPKNCPREPHYAPGFKI